MGVLPCTATSGAGTTGSKKTSSAPPDRQWLKTVTVPGGSLRSGSSRGVIRSNRLGPPDSSSPRLRSRTVNSAQVPPTNPSTVPSGSTSASSPGLADVGRSTRTTRACTNGTRSLRSAAARSCTAGVM